MIDLRKITIFITLSLVFTLFVPLSVSGQPDITPPRNLNATGYDGYVELEWLPPAIGSDRVERYNIYRGFSSEDKEYYDTVNSTVQTYIDENVVNGRTYHYWVTAVYEREQETDFSNEATATPEEATIPTAPKNLTAYSGDAEVDLQWEPPESDGNSPITNYIIYRGTSSEDLEEKYILDTSLEYTDTDVTNDVTYHYAVKARNEIGDSELSEVASATPTEGISTPSAPRNLRALAGDGLVELYWEPPLDDGGSSIQNYRIERDDRLFNTGDNITFYQDELVSNDETYIYRVSAVNTAGEGLKSGEVTATPTSDVPDSIGDLQAEETDSSISINWSDLETHHEVDYFNIYRGTDENDLIYLSDTDDTEFIDTDVETETTYYYMVRGVSEDGILGRRSNIDSATVTVVDDVETEDDRNLFFIFTIIGLVILVVILSIALWMKKQPPTGYSQPEPPVENKVSSSQTKDGYIDPPDNRDW